MNLKIVSYKNSTGQTIQIKPKDCSDWITIDDGETGNAPCPKTLKTTSSRNTTFDVNDANGNYLNTVASNLSSATNLNEYVYQGDGNAPDSPNVSQELPSLSDGDSVTAEFITDSTLQGGLIIIGTLNGGTEDPPASNS